MDLENLWTKILSKIKDKVSAANYRAWFAKTKLESYDQGKMIIKVPSAFVKNQLVVRYQTMLQEAIMEITQEKVDLEYLIDSSLIVKKKQIADDEPPLILESVQTVISPTLNPKYTLDNFVVGLTNNLAYAAAQAVVANPGITYNPLFIYGPSGVGKTHLMVGIGNALLKKNPSLKVVFAPSERFMVDFVEAIQNKNTTEFRAKYRSCELLLIDDIQFISGKDSTQEEFFHTFNELYSKGVQVVLTSDRPPHEIQKLEARLTSRFQGGLMVDIQPPDFDTRVAILKTKLKESGESLPEEIIHLIAENITANTRELEGKLIQILQMKRISKEPFNYEQIKATILGQKLTQKMIRWDYKKLLSLINRTFHLKMADLVGPKRKKELVIPRQITMYLLYEDCGIPMERIGEILGGRDHTTVLHGIEKIREQIKRDREIHRLIVEIRQQMQS